MHMYVFLISLGNSLFINYSNFFKYSPAKHWFSSTFKTFFICCKLMPTFYVLVKHILKYLDTNIIIKKSNLIFIQNVPVFCFSRQQSDSSFVLLLSKTNERNIFFPSRYKRIKWDTFQIQNNYENLIRTVNSCV